MIRFQKSRILIWAVAGLAVLCLAQLITGIFDYIPRLRTQAISPDGALTVKVYQQRLMARPFFPRMGAVVKVYGVNGNLVYQDTIFRDSDFDDTLADAFTRIAFAEDEITIGPGFYDSRLVYCVRPSDWTGRYRPVAAIQQALGADSP